MKFLTARTEDKNPSDKEGYTPLHAASEKGQLNIFKYYNEELKYDNINPEQVSNEAKRNGRTPLHYATQNDHFALAQYLIGNVELSSI